MIERLFIKDCLGFKKIDLELNPGLIVFTGASGVGKTVLMKSILALTGQEDAEAKNSELVIRFPFDLENYDNEEGFAIIQQSKKEKTRFFLNDLSISKKKLSDITMRHIDFMNVKDLSIFDTTNMLYLIDSVVSQNDKKHWTNLQELKKTYGEFRNLGKELEKIQEDKDRAEEIRDILEFEINKIKNVDPRDDEELEELLKTKNQLSNREKIMELIEETDSFFAAQGAVSRVMEYLGTDNAEFEEAMSNAYAMIEDAKGAFEELEHVDIEETLTRIEQLNGLVKKYGSVGEALTALGEKESLLEKHIDIDFEESKLLKKIKDLELGLEKLDGEIFEARKKRLPEFNRLLGEYSEMLFLNNASVELEKDGCFTELGRSVTSVKLNGTSLNKVSAGELNRLKLAMLVVKTKYSMGQDNGILILDEIDANLSGKESESIGKLLHMLSGNYQILSISHQPQLTSFADQHFLVQKEGGVSSILELTGQNERQKEIARMISGEDITDKAFEFANELIGNSNEFKMAN